MSICTKKLIVRKDSVVAKVLTGTWETSTQFRALTQASYMTVGKSLSVRFSVLHLSKRGQQNFPTSEGYIKDCEGLTYYGTEHYRNTKIDNPSMDFVRRSQSTCIFKGIREVEIFKRLAE